MKFLAIPLLAIAMAATALADIQQLDPAAFAEMIGKDGTLLIDVRSPAETKDAKIENAMEINFFDEDFAEKLLQLPKDKTLLIYCRSGNRSGKAALILESKGYTKLVNMVGGVNEWKKAKLPLVKD